MAKLQTSRARFLAWLVFLAAYGLGTIHLHSEPVRAATTVDASSPIREVHHVMVYHERGRFGGWPANHGIWSWGDEILVGFSAGYHKDRGPELHNIDHDKPEEHLLARSKDGGETWSLENPAKQGVLIGTAGMRH